jgi:hypothetical protein
LEVFNMLYNSILAVSLLAASAFGLIPDAFSPSPTGKRRQFPRHQHLYYSGLVVFSSIMGAHAAVADFPDLREGDPRNAILREVVWADRPKQRKTSSVSVSTTPPAVPRLQNLEKPTDPLPRPVRNRRVLPAALL